MPPPGGTFGAPETIDAPNLQAVALASDGGAVIVRQSGVPTPENPLGVVAYLRPPGGTFGGPIAVPSAKAGGLQATMATGGRATVLSDQFPLNRLPYDGVDVDVADVTADGSSTAVADFSASGATLAGRDDGAAVIGLGRGYVMERSAYGPFGAIVHAIDGSAVAPGVSVSTSGSLVAWAFGDQDTLHGVTVEFNRRPIVLSDLATDGGAVLPVAPYARPGRHVVLSGPVRVRHGQALVPVLCAGLLLQNCSGEPYLSTGSTAIQRTAVKPHDRRVTIKLDGRTVRRRLTRGPDRRSCRVPVDARAAGRRGDARLFRVTHDGGGAAVTRLLLCRGHRPLVTLMRDAWIYATSVGPAGVVVARDVFGQARSVTVLDLSGRTLRTVPIALEFPASVFVSEPLGVVAGITTGIAFTELAGARVRVHVADADGERIADSAPGIDPDSLTVEGNTVSWLRSGVRESVLLH